MPLYRRRSRHYKSGKTAATWGKHPHRDQPLAQWYQRFQGFNASKSGGWRLGVCPKSPCGVFREESRVFARYREGDGFSGSRPRILPFRLPHGTLSLRPNRGTSDETYVSAEQSTSKAQTRVPIPDAYSRRPGDGETSSNQRSSGTFCLSGKSSSRSVLPHGSHRSTNLEHAVHEVAFWYSRAREIRGCRRWAS